MSTGKPDAGFRLYTELINEYEAIADDLTAAVLSNYKTPLQLIQAWWQQCFEERHRLRDMTLYKSQLRKTD